MGGQVSRRGFLKNSAIAFGALAVGGKINDAVASDDGKSKVYFTDDISVNGLLKVYSKVNGNISGKTGIKLHTGEPHGPNLLPVELIKGLQAKIPDSNIVECNVLYPSPRQNTQGHLETIKTNGFTFCPVDIMDADGGVSIPVNGVDEFMEKWGGFGVKNRPFTPGFHLRSITVGKNFVNYDSLVVYTHFKGHAMGGFGGSLKNISIGCASGRVGKREIHGDGWPGGELFLERMVEAGKGMVDHFNGKITFINVLKNISVDCDCDAHGAKPTCRDIGILASTDILAIDKASVDLVYNLPPVERKDIVERIESRKGLHQLEYMKALGMGSDQYNMIKL